MRRADARRVAVQTLYIHFCLDFQGKSGIPGPLRTYPELFALMGGRVPDLRGLFLRGHGGNSAGLGVTQGDAIRNIRGTIAGYNGGIRAMDGAFVQGWSEYATSAGNNFNIPSGVYFDASRVVPTAEENRPANTAVRYLVRSRP